MKNRWLTFVFLLFLCSCCLAQSNQERIDSLQQIIANQQGDAKALSLLEFAKLFEKELPKAFGFIQKATELTKNPEIIAKSHLARAYLFAQQNNDLDRLKEYDVAIQMLKGVNDTLMAEVLNDKSKVYERKGNYDESLKIRLDELKWRQKLNQKEAEVYSLQQVGYIYDRMNDFDQAITWHKKSLDLALQTRDNVLIGRAYGLIGIAYDEMQDYQKALDYNFKAVDYFKKTDTSYLFTWYSNIGNTYIKLEDYSQAEKFTLLALTASNAQERYVTRVNLANIYQKKGAYDKAEKVLQSVIQDLIKTDNTKYLSEAYFVMHELHKKKGNYAEALVYYEKFKEKEDEYLNEQKIKSINELTIQFETEKKQNQILQQKNQIYQNQIQLKNRRLWLIRVGALAIIIGLIGALFYFKQRNKIRQQKRESDLQLAIKTIENQNKLQEQRLAISRDLHDNIGSQLTFIISSIDTTKMFLGDENKKLSERLAQINAFTKDTILELRDTIWAMNNSQIGLEDLQTRILNFIDNAGFATEKISFKFQNKINNFNQYTLNSKNGMHVYRILQEAINNAIKHANASFISIKLSEEKKHICLQIKDNGQGIDASGNSYGNGLKSMQNRAKDMGGELSIVSAESGTTIQLKIPKNAFQN